MARIIVKLVSKCLNSLEYDGHGKYFKLLEYGGHINISSYWNTCLALCTGQHSYGVKRSGVRHMAI